MAAVSCRTGPHSDEFDSEKWKSSSQHWSAARYRMLDSLTEDVGVVGKSQDEIRDLLGEGGKPWDTHWTYHVSPHGTQFRYFTVVFEDDVVVSWAVTVRGI